MPGETFSVRDSINTLIVHGSGEGGGRGGVHAATKLPEAQVHI